MKGQKWYLRLWLRRASCRRGLPSASKINAPLDRSHLCLCQSHAARFGSSHWLPVKAQTLIRSRCDMRLIRHMWPCHISCHCHPRSMYWEDRRRMSRLWIQFVPSAKPEACERYDESKIKGRKRNLSGVQGILRCWHEARGNPKREWPCRVLPSDPKKRRATQKLRR